ncbi:MAG TPA: hypothetical protein PK228_00105 [Saprospiraceae bacterium]|nr:hypothetical protein [Saprospiraceae bacterium]
MKHLFVVGTLCLFVSPLSAQKTAESTVQSGIRYNQHKYEIGIDVKSIFSLQGIGTGLIFKKRIGEKKYISVYEKKALRLLLGGGMEVPANAAVEANFSGTDLREENLKTTTGFILAGIGLEWQKQKGRIQFFYGGDISTVFSALNTGFYNSVYIANQNIYANVYYDRSRSVSTGTNGFGGIRFFFSPQFSVSAESGMYLGYRSDNTSFHYSYYDSNLSVQTVEEVEKVGSFIWKMQYLRSLYFSYYF